MALISDPQDVQIDPKDLARRLRPDLLGGMRPATLDPNASTPTQTNQPLATSPLSQSPAPVQFPAPPNRSDYPARKGALNRLAEIGLAVGGTLMSEKGLAGGLDLEQNYANAPYNKAMQDYDLQRQHSSDVAGQQEKKQPEPKSVEPGSMVQQPDGTWKQVGQKQEPTKEPLHVPPGEMVQQPDGTFAQVGQPKQPEQKSPELKTVAGPDGKVYYATEDNTGKLVSTGQLAPRTFGETGMYEPITDANGQTVKFDRRTGQTSAIASAGGKTAPVLSSQQSSELKTVEESSRDADTRLRIMKSNEDKALKGDQQAALSLVSNHIGMTLGAQKGARINQAVWNEAIQSAPVLARAQAHFDSNGYLTGVVLTPDQIKQMVSLGETVREQKWRQTYDTMTQFGATDYSHVIPDDVLKGFSGAGEGLTGPPAAQPGMKVQSRTVNGKTEYRQVPIASK